MHIFILLQGNIAIPLKNEAGTGDLLAIPLFSLIALLLLLWLLKSKSNLSMIKKYQRSITESNVNGYISYYALIILIIVFLIFIVSSISGKVSIYRNLVRKYAFFFVDFWQPEGGESWYPRRVR